MKKQLLFLFLCVSMTLTGWAQSISFTSALTTAQVGSTVTVNYQYTIPANGFIYCSIELLNDWSWVSNVAIAQLYPAPAGTNVTGSFDLTIPNGTLPTSSLLSPQNYKIKIELKNLSYVWVAGAYPGTQIDITPMPGVPTVSQLSGDGTNTITHGCESSAISILGTNFTGATAVTVGGTPLASYTVVSSTRIDGILPTGSHVGPVVVTTSDGSGTSAGNFTVAVPGTTNTTTITSFETYTWPHNGMTYTTSGIKTGNTADCVTELLDLTITTAAPAITFTSIPTSTPAGTDLTVNYQYTVPADGYIYCGLELHDSNGYVSGVASAQLNPAPSGTNATGSLNLAIPSGTTPTANLTGTFFYKIKIELKSLPGYDYLAGDFPSTPVNISAPAPSISFTSIPTTTVAGTDLTVNYQYTIPANGYIYCALELQNTDTWALASTVASAQLDPAPAGTNVSGTFNLSIPNGTIPSTSLSGQTYRIKIELKDSSYSYLADAFPSTPVIITTQYTYYADADADGYGDVAAEVVVFYTSGTHVGYSANNTDCDDTKAAVHPGAIEIFDTIDNNCDGNIDEGTTLGAPVVANTGICKGAVGATPSATALPGYTLVWYKDGTTTTALAAAPVITATKTFFVAQRLGSNAISPRVSVTTTVNLLPTTPSPLVLTQGATVIKKVGNFIGTTTPLTLTATAVGAVPAVSYNWALPEGVNQTGGTNTNEITINFNNVTAGITPLDLFVSSVSAEGCVSKTAKKLTVTRAVPGAPKGLTITDAELPSVLKITKLDAYTGALKTRPLTLTATANTTAGLQASSYKWVLPAAVTTTATPVVGEANTYTSSSNVISITLGNYTNEVSYSFQVYGVNGNGTSAVKSLTCTSAAPKTPAIVASSTIFNTCSTRTYTATDILGATYNWTIPAGASFVGEGPFTGNVIEVSFTGVTTVPTYAVTCSASNGNGTGFKSLTIKRAATCTKIAPEDVVAEDELSVIAYPNPSSSEFTIEASRKGASVKVYDMMGRLIENRQATSNSVQVGRNFASGIYNVIVSQGAKAKILKVIKR